MYPKYILVCSIWGRLATGFAVGIDWMADEARGPRVLDVAAAKASWRCCSRAAGSRSPE